MSGITIYDDPIFLKNSVVFFGPKLGAESGKIGIYGGSFDPPHNCHKLRVQQLYDAKSLIKIVIPVAANHPRKPNMLPQEDRYKWTVMMIEELLMENKDQLLGNFLENPQKNSSKIEVIIGEPGAGDTIRRIREENPGFDVIFIYGSDYALKEGNTTPLNRFDPPVGWLGNTVFYRGVAQIQFPRTDTTCNASSTKIRSTVSDLLEKGTELTDELIHKLAQDLELSPNILKSYIQFVIRVKSGGRRRRGHSHKRKSRLRRSRRKN